MLIGAPYDRRTAVDYARRYALSRNPLFVDFTGRGGNCTNFVSQSILAGCGIMNFTPTFGWYYINVEDRAPAWSGVEAFYDFMTGCGDFGGVVRQGPYASLARSRGQVDVGDVVQLADSSGDFYHTLIISELGTNEIYVCAHSDDALDRPLSSYNYASLRVLHIEGAMLDVPTETVATELADGIGLLSVRAVAEELDAAM